MDRVHVHVYITSAYHLSTLLHTLAKLLFISYTCTFVKGFLAITFLLLVIAKKPLTNLYEMNSYILRVFASAISILYPMSVKQLMRLVLHWLNGSLRWYMSI